MTELIEHNIWLNPHDMDHLEQGAPVYKPIGNDLLILRAGDWETLKQIKTNP